MNAELTHRLDGELDDLWFRRGGLSEPEWVRLHTIVCEVLLPYRPTELGGLREEREIYVQDFFVDKVFRPDTTPSHVHVGSLRVYYRRFLRDRLDQANVYGTYFEPLDPDETGEGHRAAMSSHVIDAEERDEHGFDELKEIGWSINDLRASARTWLESNERWVPIYLALNFCPDDDERAPLVHVASRFGIRSYAYRAAKLGINWDLTSRSPPSKAFAATMIGRWVEQELRIEIAPENGATCLAVFKILCLETLDWAERSNLA